MKRLLCAALLGLLLSPVFAIDFGFDLTNTTNLTNDNSFALPNNDNSLLLDQKDRLQGWFSAMWENYALRVEGFYDFTGDFNATGSVIVPYRFDVGNTFFYWQMPNLASQGTGALSLGRIYMADQAGRILSGLSDGVDFAVKTTSAEFDILAGYTGFLSKKDANIIISDSDFVDAQDSKIYFAPQRLFFGGKAKFLELFLRHDLDVELHSQFDLRANSPIHNQYLELGLDGRPLRWLKYRAYTILESWWNPVFNLSMAAGLRLQFSVPETAGLVILANLDWASGTSGNLRAFAPLKQTPMAYIYRASFTDIVALSLNAAISPLDGVATGIAAYSLFRASDKPPSDVLFPSTATSSLLGFETIATVDFTISSDFGLSIKGGAFFPNVWSDGYPAGTPTRWLASLELKLNI